MYLMTALTECSIVEVSLKSSISGLIVCSRSETPDTLSLIEYDRIGIEEHFRFLFFNIER